MRIIYYFFLWFEDKLIRTIYIQVKQQPIDFYVLTFRLKQPQLINIMRFFNNLLNLFHRKQRMNPQYATLSSLKKWVFYGLTGFTLALGISKFLMSDLQFAFEPTEQNRLIIKMIPALDRGFYHPNLFMLLGIFQRLYAQYFQQEPYLRINDQQFQGQNIQWIQIHDKAMSSPKRKNKPIPLVVVISGSEGPNNTVTKILQSIYSLGYRTIGLNPRDLHDRQKLGKLIAHIQQKHPQSQIYGIGVEYGANLLINFAADNPDTFKGLVSIGNPYNLTKSEINLESSFLWKPLYWKILKGKIEKGSSLNKNFDKQKSYTLHEVDQHIYQIKQPSEYVDWKHRNSSVYQIGKLKQPVLFLQSKEDPFTIPIQGQEFENQKCIYVSTQRGGHNEWFSNMWMDRWFLSPVKAYIKLLHQEKVNKILKRGQKASENIKS